MHNGNRNSKALTGVIFQTEGKVGCSCFILNKRTRVVKVQAIYMYPSLPNVMSAVFKVLW